MGLISKSKLRSIRENAVRMKSANWLNESISAKNRLKRFNEVTIFLSHKHDETEYLKDAIAFLNSLGVSVYVDWLDEGMPKTTSGLTAQRIKKKIIEMNKFILLATEGAISSKWCNWELGYGDAKKYPINIAILPVKENISNYTGSEYLQIYPYICESDTNIGTFIVKYPDGRVVNLANWLTSNN